MRKERRRANLMSIDDALRPMEMTCGNCGGKMVVYPAPIPIGTGVCPNCSPNWLGSFALHLTNVERAKYKLESLKA